MPKLKYINCLVVLFNKNNGLDLYIKSVLDLVFSINSSLRIKPYH